MNQITIKLNEENKEFAFLALVSSLKDYIDKEKSITPEGKYSISAAEANVMLTELNLKYPEEYKIASSQHSEVNSGMTQEEKESTLKKDWNRMSVLRLDKNFHLYVHGKKDLIDVDKDVKGKFLKVYFNEIQ